MLLCVCFLFPKTFVNIFYIWYLLSRNKKYILSFINTKKLLKILTTNNKATTMYSALLILQGSRFPLSLQKILFVRHENLSERYQ